MAILRNFHGVSMIFYGVSKGVSMVQYFCGIPMVIQKDVYGISFGFLWIPMGFLWYSFGISFGGSMIFLLDSYDIGNVYGISMIFL